MNNKEWIANVQYGDLAGTAAADGHENAIGELRTYLKGKGVDTSNIEPIGLKIGTVNIAFPLVSSARIKLGRLYPSALKESRT